MLEYAKPIIAAIIAIVIVGLAYGINHAAYKRGYNDAILLAMVSKAKIEHEYKGKMDTLEMQVTKASNERNAIIDDINRAISLRKPETANHNPSNTKPAIQPNATRTGWQKRFDQCESDYIKLVSDTAKYADTVNGLQQYSRDIQR